MSKTIRVIGTPETMLRVVAETERALLVGRKTLAGWREVWLPRRYLSPVPGGYELCGAWASRYSEDEIHVLSRGAEAADEWHRQQQEEDR